MILKIKKKQKTTICRLYNTESLPTVNECVDKPIIIIYI